MVVDRVPERLHRTVLESQSRSVTCGLLEQKADRPLEAEVAGRSPRIVVVVTLARPEGDFSLSESATERDGISIMPGEREWIRYRVEGVC